LRGRRVVIVLMGLRASGKTTLGRAVAERVGWRFVDLDERVCVALGVEHAGEAFARLGEAAFRAAEREELERVLGEASGSGEVVVSLGGGTPTAAGAGALLRRASAAGARVVYLRNGPETLSARLRGAPADANRPALTRPADGEAAGGDEAERVAAEVGEVFARRDGLYVELATDVVEADGLEPEALIEVLAGMAGGAKG